MERRNKAGKRSEAKNTRLVKSTWDRNNGNRELEHLALALSKHFAKKKTRERYISTMSEFMEAVARKAFLKTGKNENGDVDFYFNPGSITAADIKAHLAISKESADQIFSIMHDQKGQDPGLQLISFWVQPVFECIWAKEEAIKFIAEKLGTERKSEAVVIYERIEKSREFYFPSKFIDCASTIIKNLVSFCRKKLSR